MNPRTVKLSTNFTLHEMLWSDLAGRHAKLSKNGHIRAAQKRLIGLMVDKLETVRGWYGGKRIFVLSAVRDAHIHAVLKAAHLAPSPKSDHSYLHAYHPFGVGAVDFHVEGVPSKRVMEDIRRLLPEAQFGTAIWYPPSAGNFIHLSNPREALILAHAVPERYRWKDNSGHYSPFLGGNDELD